MIHSDEVIMQNRLLLHCVALALFSGTTAISSAAERHVYQGELEGAGTIVMELEADETPGKYKGRYFYPRHGVDIPLSGTAGALIEPTSLLELTGNIYGPNDFDGPAFDHPVAIWNGNIDAAGFRGQWEDTKKNRKRHFNLQHIASYDPDIVKPDAIETISENIAGGISTSVAGNAMIDMQQSPYEYLKLTKHSVPIGEAMGNASLAIQMWQDPRTKLHYPRLIRHPDANVLTRVNLLLEQRHWQMNLAALECAATRYTSTGPESGTLGAYDEENIHVNFLSKAIISISESGSIFCGGAHPNNHYDLANFDLIRGEYLDWNRIMHAYIPGEYGNQIASEPLRGFIEKASSNPKYLLNTSIDGEDYSCAEVLPEYLALSFAVPDKLSFNVSGIGHAMGVCLGPQLEVPFKKIKPLLKPTAKAYLSPGIEIDK
jgi:hypothetical protein